MERDIEYENNNIRYDNDYDQYGIKCKNYKVCNATLPNWWFECKGRYLCTNCDMSFGTWTSIGINRTGKGALDFEDNIECPICYETSEGVSYPNCDHKVCISCFKRNWYGDNDLENEPKFPYPDIEDEYFDDMNPEGNERWKDYREGIDQYNNDWNRFDDLRQIKYEQEKYLRKCPLCRC